MNEIPTRIRGVDYPSMKAAAIALGVKPPTVWKAAERGTLDSVGLCVGTVDKVGLRHPCWYRGKLYPSHIAAALDNGVTRACVSQSVKRAARQMAA